MYLHFLNQKKVSHIIRDLSNIHCSDSYALGGYISEGCLLQYLVLY